MKRKTNKLIRYIKSIKLTTLIDVILMLFIVIEYIALVRDTATTNYEQYVAMCLMLITLTYIASSKD